MGGSIKHPEVLVSSSMSMIRNEHDFFFLKAFLLIMLIMVISMAIAHFYVRYNVDYQSGYKDGYSEGYQRATEHWKGKVPSTSIWA